MVSSAFHMSMSAAIAQTSVSSSGVAGNIEMSPDTMREVTRDVAEMRSTVEGGRASPTATRASCTARLRRDNSESDDSESDEDDRLPSARASQERQKPRPRTRDVCAFPSSDDDTSPPPSATTSFEKTWSWAV